MKHTLRQTPTAGTCRTCRRKVNERDDRDNQPTKGMCFECVDLYNRIGATALCYRIERGEWPQHEKPVVDTPRVTGQTYPSVQSRG